MRNLVVLTTLTFFLMSCAGPAAPGTSTSVSTSTLTLPPSATPAPTLTPTATVDPIMPPDATGKDAKGNYIKTENGLTVVWSAELKTWERHLNLDDKGIPLVALSQESHALGLRDLLWLHVNVSDKVPGFASVETLSYHKGANITQGPSFGNQFWNDLLKKMGPNVQSYQQVQNGDVSIPFITSEGPQSWKLGSEAMVQVDIIDEPVDAGFQDYKDPYRGAIWKVRIFADNQGNLHSWVVPDQPLDQLKKEQLIEIYLLAPAVVIGDSDQTVPHFTQNLSNYIGLLTSPSRPPFIDFGPEQ